MLKQLIESLKPGNGASTKSRQNQPEPAALEPEVIARDDHCISRKQISKNALTVIYELRRAGYEAYLVGGGVRDLLLGLTPKDFDVATNATPEQVHQQFKRARIVGRRFKIVHVRFGREIIEVTTFRAGHDQLEDSAGANKKAQANAQGMLLRDNVYGSLRDDALRRDFTVNALYYSVDGFTVLDYVNGLADLNQRILRIIGDASQRYAEDPVRMLRAIRFSAKFDFELEPSTAAPLSSHGQLLDQVAPARLFDEIIKLLLSGNGLRTFELLVEYGLLRYLFPATAPFLADDPEHNPNYQLIRNALANTDQRIAEDKPVTPAFLYAALLWPKVSQQAASLEAEGAPRLRALQIAGHQAIDEMIPVIAIPKRFSIASREIWTLQQRLETAQGKRAIAVLKHPRFRAAYDFLLLREQIADQDPPRGEFWTQLQEEHPVSSGKDHKGNQDKPRRKRSRRRYSKPSKSD